MRTTFVLALAALIWLAGACAGDGGRETAITSPATTPAAAETVAARPSGTLRIASGFGFPSTLDPTKGNGAGAYQAWRHGTGEMLTRVTADHQIEPWLAERVEPVAPTIWRVSLRPEARFHDGSPVGAEDVAAALRTVQQGQPAAAAFLPKETRIEVEDARTLRLTTPAPVAAFPNNLASHYLVIFKPSPDGAVTTGPYRPIRFQTDTEVELAAFEEHWAGPPPIARVTVRKIGDNAARLLALRAGEIDYAMDLAPEQLRGLPPELEGMVSQLSAVHTVAFNLGRPPFDDRAAREAFVFGIDRAQINAAALDGQGRVAGNVFPEGIGLPVDAAQRTDRERARRALDDAGWRPDADGVRAKDGRRLAVTLYSYPGYSGATAMATAIGEQLKPLGFAITVRERADLVTAVLPSGDWEAAMVRSAPLLTGDPAYSLTFLLGSRGPYNFGKYASAEFDAALVRMGATADPAERRALVLRAQQLLSADLPAAFLVTDPRAVAVRKGSVTGFIEHPSDPYVLNRLLSVR